MRIVHIEDFIHPDTGYQVNLLSRLQVQQGHEVFVVTAELDKVPTVLTQFFGRDNIEARDRRFQEATGVEIIRVPLLGWYSGRAIFYPRIFKIVDSLQPDVAFVHGEDVLTGILYILRSSKLNYPLVLDDHSVEMGSVHKLNGLFRLFFRTIITPQILRKNIPLIRVVDSDYVEKHYGFPLERTTLLSFGTDTSYFRPDPDRKTEFRRKYAIGLNDFVVIYAGKLDKHKGGQFFADAIREKLVTASGRKIVVVVVGTTTGEYGKKVEETFARSETRMLRFPTQTYSDLAPFYQAADLSIFPKQCSLSFFEVQSCGLPVLVEQNEINDLRVQFGNGERFAPEDIGDFRSKLVQFAEMSEEKFKVLRVNARRYVQDNYDFVPIARKFTDLMANEVERFKQKRRQGRR